MSNTAESVDLATDSHPVLTGVEAPFLDYWLNNVVDLRDPHLHRWIDYEESAVSRATERVAAMQRYKELDGAVALDIGCQNGAKLVALGLAGATPLGIDVEAEAVQAVSARLKCYDVEATATVGDACNLDFPDESIDLVCSSDVYEHVHDKGAMLDETMRVLRPGGLLVIGAPQRFSVKHFVSDPHYNHPLLSVLPANAASLLNRRLFGEAVYEVETLPTRAKTKRELVARGLELQEDPTSASNGLVSNLVDELRQGFVLYGIKR